MYAIKIVILFIAESCIALHWNYFDMSLFLIQFVSSAPLLYTIYVFHFTVKVFFLSLLLNCFATIHFFVTYWKKKLSTDLEDAFVRFNLFWDAMIDGYPWAPSILQKPVRSYWLIWKDSLIDFHVVLKAAELLFFRLKILFNWKIIVVEVTETFLSSGN